MQPTLPFRFIIRFVSLFTCLVILTTLVQPSPVLAKKPGSRPLTILRLSPMEDEVCVGEMVHFNFSVSSGMVPIPGVSVTVNGMALKTGWDGGFYWDQKFDSAGEQSFTIAASKKGYDSASDKMTVTVAECTWTIGLTYFEDFVEPANIWEFQASIESEHEPFAFDADNKLTLLRGSSFQAQYDTTLFGLLPPIWCETVPKVNGVYQIQFGGKLNNDQLKIDLSAAPIMLPDSVSVQCHGEVNGITVKGFPFPMARNVDLIKSANIAHLLFGKNGGVRRFKLSHLLFWPINQAGSASGLVVVTKAK